MTDLPELEQRIKQAKARKAQAEEPQEERRSGDAGRVVSELVGGLVVGCGGGWLIDSYFGTLPIFFLICSLLGIFAALKTISRMGSRIAEDE